MDKKKQIEEMAILIRTGICLGVHCEMIATVIYEDGYQKQIVRCKDCKYYEKLTNTGKNGGEMWCCRCGALTRVKQDGESFCSFAERKENDDVG